MSDFGVYWLLNEDGGTQFLHVVDEAQPCIAMVDEENWDAIKVWWDRDFDEPVLWADGSTR